MLHTRPYAVADFESVGRDSVHNLALWTSQASINIGNSRLLMILIRYRFSRLVYSGLRNALAVRLPQPASDTRPGPELDAQATAKRSPKSGELL
jgi:hypothetical protein